LSVAAAVATARWLTNKTDENVRIKWPNAIYWHDRKAGGILIESVISANETSGSQWKWAVIGIGLNTNQGSFSNDLPNPVSLLQIAGKTHPVNIRAKQLCAELASTWQSLRQNKFAELLEEY